MAFYTLPQLPGGWSPERNALIEMGASFAAGYSSQMQPAHYANVLHSNSIDSFQVQDHHQLIQAQAMGRTSEQLIHAQQLTRPTEQLIHAQQMARTTESKPRLSKEEVEVLEAEFQRNHKPNTNTKKRLADTMGVEPARINNWFQNRRARQKKENNIREYEARQRLEKEEAEAKAGAQGTSDKRDSIASSAPFSDSPFSKSDLDPRQSTPQPAEDSRDDNPVSSIVLPTTEEDDDMEGDDLPGELDDLAESVLRGQEGSAMHSLSMSNGQGSFGTGFGSISLSHDIEEFDHSATVPSRQFEFPVSSDFASSGNVRPGGLGISGSRSFSGISRVGDGERVMRRVASVGGPVRVTKSRSPMQQHRAPIVAPSRASSSFQTQPMQSPNSGYPVTVRYSSSALSEAPNLKTLPRTLGILDSGFPPTSSYSTNVPVPAMVQPTMRSFPGEFEATPEYITEARACRSQPTASFFPPTTNAGYMASYTDPAGPTWADLPLALLANSGLSFPQHSFSDPIMRRC